MIAERLRKETTPPIKGIAPPVRFPSPRSENAGLYR
jgi:hypothetical protein